MHIARSLSSPKGQVVGVAIFLLILSKLRPIGVSACQRGSKSYIGQASCFSFITIYICIFLNQRTLSVYVLKEKGCRRVSDQLFTPPRSVMWPTTCKRQDATQRIMEQGKSEGFDSCDLPTNLTQIGYKSLTFQPMWPWILIDDLEKL